MKLYTKTGDLGETGLFGGARVSKASDRVGAYGTVDELNATLGVVRTHPVSAATSALLARVQSDLFTLGAELATVPGKEQNIGIALLDEGDVARLEAAIDESEAAELLSKMDNRITERVADALRDGDDLKAIEKAVRRAAGSFVSQSTRRRPMIVPIVLEG